jgi:hypothetical protein
MVKDLNFAVNIVVNIAVNISFVLILFMLLQLVVIASALYCPCSFASASVNAHQFCLLDLQL